MTEARTVLGKAVRVQGNVLRVGRLDAEKFEFVDEPRAMLEAMSRAGIKMDLFTFLQRLPDTAPKFSYPMESDNLAVLEVSTYDHWWTKQLDNKTRNMIRRAEKKGVVVREMAFDDTLARGICEIYNETPMRQGKRFPHYGKDFETVRREAATYLDRSVFLCAYSGEQLIGFVKLTEDEERTQTSIMNIIGMVKYRDLAPMNALIADCVRYTAERQIPRMVYANFAYGNKKRDSLADFKHNNGFKQVDLPRYYVPITAAGSLFFKLGMHKKLTDRVPEAVLSKLRDARNQWYSRKHARPTEAR